MEQSGRVSTTGGDNLLIHINPPSLPWPDKLSRGFLATAGGFNAKPSFGPDREVNC